MVTLWLEVTLTVTISSNINYKMLDEINYPLYPFPNLNLTIVEVYGCNFIPHFAGHLIIIHAENKVNPC